MDEETDNDDEEEEYATNAFSYEPTTPKPKGNLDNTNEDYATSHMANPPQSPALHTFWKVVQDENLESHRFQTLVKDVTLQDDSMHGLRHFYTIIKFDMPCIHASKDRWMSCHHLGN